MVREREMIFFYAWKEGNSLGKERTWGMEIRKTSGVLASFPLAVESINRNKHLFLENERESEIHQRNKNEKSTCSRGLEEK